MTLAERALLHPPLDNEMEFHYSIHCSSILSAPHFASKLQSGDLKPTPVLTLLQSIVEALLSSLGLEKMIITYHRTAETGALLR